MLHSERIFTASAMDVSARISMTAKGIVAGNFFSHAVVLIQHHIYPVLMKFCVEIIAIYAFTFATRN